jgi:hypothetical protein
MTGTADWQKLANALRELHRTLLECARRDYEREHVVTLTPGELLQLLTTNAEFEWLRGLSELMVDFDLVRDAAPAERDEVADAVRAAIEHLLSNAPAPAGAFAQRYWPYVHADPLVAMAHAGVKQALAAWPPAQSGDASGLLHERHRLAEKARHLSRRH